MRYEVLLDLDGDWRGMVHVFDTSKPKERNQDVMVSGARWSFETHVITVTVDDIFGDPDASLVAEVLAHASIELRRALLN